MLYSIVDIESTGGNAKQGKIIEIAIFVYNGKKIVDSFCTFVNPGVKLSPYIIQLTGITDKMLVDAPTFENIAKRVAEITRQTVVVAHNVRFDYGFLKEELRRCHKKFERKRLCTQELSKKIYPNLKAYGLGKICEMLEISMERQHRAIDDAKATAYLFDKMLNSENHDLVMASLNKEDQNHWPPNLPLSEVQKLPENAGLYKFKNADKKIIYIGRSNDIQDRVFQHFAEFPASQWRKEMFNEVYSVIFELTGSELLSLILESYEIKKHRPIYNQKRKSNSFTWGVIHFKDDKGYIRFSISKVKQRNLALSYHRTEGSAREYLNDKIRQFSLMPFLCGINASKRNSGYPEINAYNKKALLAIDSFNYPNKNFLIISEGRHNSEAAVVLVQNEKFKGYDYFEKEMLNYPYEVAKLIKPMMANFEVDLIIKSYIRNGHLIEILPFQKTVVNN